MALVTLGAIAVLGGGAAAAGAVAGGYTIRKKKKAKKKLEKQHDAIAKEEEKQEELECKTREELLQMKQGDSYVQYALGMIDKDSERSKSYLKAASAQGHAYAAYRLGEGHQSGKLDPLSEDIALDYYLCAADRGLAIGASKAADIYFQRENWKDAKKYYKRSIALGNENAVKNAENAKLHTSDSPVQCQYAKSLIEEENYEEALYWLTKAADQGSPEAAYRLGTFYLYGNGVAKNEDKAMMLLSQASSDGWSEATELLASIFEEKGMYEEAILRLEMLPRKTNSINLKIGLYL